MGHERLIHFSAVKEAAQKNILMKKGVIVDFAAKQAQVAREKAIAVGNSPQVAPIREKAHNFYNFAKKSVIDNITDPLLINFADKVKPLIPKALENCVDAHPTYPKGLSKDLKEAVKNGFTIVVPISHTSIYDAGVAAVNIASYLKESIGEEAKIVMPVIDSFGSGHQGPFLKRMSDIMDDSVRPYGIAELWKILRQKDINNGAVPTQENIDNALKISHVAELGVHLIIAPEGTVDGGRWKKRFKPWLGRKGMRPPESNRPILGKVITEAWRNNKKIAFLPTAIIGSENVFSPNYNLPTPEGLYAAITEKNLGTVQVKSAPLLFDNEVWALAERRCLARIPEGKKVNRKDIEKEVGIVILGIIATLKPENQRGVYIDTFAETTIAA